MSVNDHWMYQGRQSHGWFGTGTAPKDGDDDVAGTNELFRPSNASERVDAAAHLIIASVPRNERGRWSYAASDAGRDRLKTAVAAWYGASAMSRDAFRTQFLNPYTSDETVDRLRGAARSLIEARSYDDLGEASSKLSAAARQIGPDRWPQFIGSAARQAQEAADRGDVPGIIRVQYESEALAGMIIMSGIGLAIGSVLGEGQPSRPQTSGSPGRSTVMQVAPPPPKKEAGASGGNPDEDSSTSTAASKGTDGKGKQSPLPANPDDLLRSGWIETTRPEAAAKGHRDFENPQTGEKVRFDKGRLGQTGNKAVDHYHRENPSKTGDRDTNLDADGNVTPRGSKSSHIFPGDSR
jgi:hypothetical protein